jgi:hypothetical protein
MSESEDLTNIRLSSVIIEDTNNDIETGYISDKINNQKNQKYKSILISKNNDIENINKFKINMCIKILATLLLLTLYGPIIVADLYYSYTDHSCVHLPADNLYIDLSVYLKVTGISEGIAVITTALYIIFKNLSHQIQYENPYLLKFVTNIVMLFQVAWTIVGSIIFWGLIDNKKCHRGIYNYMFAHFIIRYFVFAINIRSTKK